MKTKLLLAGWFYLLCSLPALAQITWQGTSNRDWATATNWSPSQVPTAADNVVIPSATNTPIVGAGTSASANAVTVQGGASLSIASMGSLTVYGSVSDGTYTTTFRNLGTVNNSGQLILGSTTAASFGLVNEAIFVNNQSGQISVDRTNQIALWNPISATFTNQGNITTGGAVGTSGASIYNEATFQNSGGIITIDRAIGSAIYDRPGSSFVNSGTLAIGQNASNSGPGIYNFGNFQNLVGGAINIDQTYAGITNLAGMYNGVTNNASISFTNAGKIALGQKTEISGPGIFNYSNSAYPITFENKPGGTILVDRSYTAISNNFNVTFINSGTIAAGQQSAIVGGAGIYNNSNDSYPQSFTNNAGAAIVIDRASGGISNQQNISFVNAGTITVGQSATNTAYSPGIYNTSNFNANMPVTFENRSGGVISLDRVGTGIHNDMYCTFTNTGLLKIGTVGAIGYNPGIYNRNVFTNQEGAEIQLDKLGATGIQIDGGTFTNGGKITIGISTTLASYYPAINNGGYTASVQFNNLSTGKIYIDRCSWVGFYNYATLTNAGLIAIGNDVLGGQQGVYNTGTLTNQSSGTITVDHIDAQNYSANGIYNDYNKTFTNDGRLIIGQTTSAGTNGLYNYGTFSNTNSISIDNVTSTTANTLYTHGLYNASSFTNTGQLTIGSKGSVGRWGLYNTSTFNNNSGGAITIDRSTFAGLRNDSNFANAGQVNIGSNASVGDYGLYNTSTFNNNTGGKLTVDNATSTGIRNGDLYFTSSTFTNAGVVTIGSKSTVGDYGLFNSTKFINSDSLTIGALASTTAVGFTNPTPATFTNNACAVVTLLDKLVNSGLLTNQGLFTANTTKPHDNTALTNNGIIVYPQGNPIPNVTNNDLIAGPISTTCGTATPALQIGGSNSFSVGSSWYKESTLTTVAGTYSPNTFVATDLPGGTVPLYFAITDPTNGCTRTVSIPVTVDAPPALTVTTSGTLTCAQTSVTITANATGGTSYTLNNSTTNTMGQFVVTSSGTYTLTVANASGCTSTTTVTVFSNTTVPTNVSLSSGTLTCGQPSLTLTASATGAASYSFSGGTPLGGNQVVVNTPGAYTVTAIGANGCASVTSVTVSQDNTAPSASILPMSATLTCASPTVSLTASGGDSYRWDDGSVSAVRSVSVAGTYSVTVTNGATGCASVTSVTVNQNNAVPTAGLTTSGTLTCAQTSVTLTATPGGLTYTFNGPGVVSRTNNTAVVNAAGLYSVTVTNGATGCASVTSVTVNQNNILPTAGLIASGTLTCAQTSVTLTATPGGLAYQFSGPGNIIPNGNTAIVNTPGLYSVTVTNGATGCASVTSVTVNQDNAVPTASLVSSGTLTCAQTSVTLTATPGGLTYTFNGPGVVSRTNNTAVVNAAGLYSVTVTNGATGCASVTSITVSQDNTAPSASILPMSATLTCASPTVSLTATGGGTYRWEDNSITAVRSVSTAGTYSVTVTAVNGCTAVKSATVTGTPAITATIAGATTLCADQTTSLTATGGDTYVWSIGQNSPVVSVTAGVYALTATSGSCSATASFTLTSLPLPQPPTLLTSSDPNRPNLSVPGGLTSATVTVGDPGLAILTGNCAGTVSWSASNGTSGTGNFVVPTTIPATLSFTATCNNGTCTSSPSDPLVVTILGGPTALRLIEPTYDCQSGAITFQTAGGNGTTVEFRGIGITDWTTNPNQTVDLAIRQDPNSQPLLLQARQSGMVTTYTFDFRLYCSGTGPNQPPVFTQPPAQTAVVGQAFSYRIPDQTFRGINGTAVNFAVAGLPNGLQYSSLTRIISGTATAVGTYSVTLSVNDPQSLSATGTMTIVINPAPVVQPPVSGTTNVAPVFNGPLATQYGTVGTAFTYTLPGGVFTDANVGDVLTLSAVGLPAGLGFNPTTGVISGTPTMAATTSVTLTATDPGSLSISGLLSIVISASATPPPTGPQPLVVLQPLYNCQTGAITFQTSGGDGSPVYFSCIGVVASSTVASYTLDAAIRNDANSQPLLIKATQGGVVGSFIFDFRLYCTSGIPTPPIFAGPIGPVSGTVGVGLSYQIPGNAFNSSGGAALNYTVTGLPAGLGFAPATAIVSGTATTAGSFTATVTATDPFNQSAQGPLAFTIAPAPVVQPPVSGSALTLLAPGYNCQTGAFTFRSSGGDGVNSIEYFAVGITGWTTQAGPYTVLPASDAQPFTLKARQNGVEVSYTWDFKATCLGSPRLGVEATTPWTASVMGNPVTNELVVTLNGAEGQRLDLLLSDISGHLIEQRRIVPSVSSQRTVFDVHHQSAGLLFLQVTGGGLSQTIKVLKE